MQFLCKECFSDKELKGFIISRHQKGECSCCGRENIEVIPTEELVDFFKELFENFQPSANGKILLSKIQDNWNLFSDTNNGKKILNYFLKRGDVPIKL